MLVIAAFRVITARSPVTAVMHLILAFANAAMLWMLLGAEFWRCCWCWCMWAP